MQCTDCGREMRDAGFPGAHITCVCGAELVVPRPSALLYAASHGASPYREAPLPARLAKPTPPEKPCPRCARELVDGDDGYECEGCGGSLVRHSALKAELAHAAREAAEDSGALHARGVHLETDVRYLACPDCHETMRRMNFGHRSGVIVDVCKAHGTWFDRGERARVVEFVRMAGISVAGSPSHPLSPDAAAALRRAEVIMQYETMNAEGNAAHTIHVVDDLVSGLFFDRRLR